MKKLITASKGIICLVFLLSCTVSVRAQSNALTSQLQQALAGKKAQVGVAVIIDGKDTVTLNNETYYPMYSVFKFHQALAVMDYLARNKQPLETKLHITASDLKPDTYSPLRDKYPGGNIDMSIAELLRYTLQQSDNNACDILFNYAGGTKYADKYIRSLGITDFAIGATEEEMHQDPQKSYANRTTPLAAAELLEKFIDNRLLPDTLQAFVKQTMIECETGKDRLPQPLANTEAIIGHKTGSGDITPTGRISGMNDIGFVFLPNGHHYTIAVFVKDSDEGPQATTALIAEISRIVYHNISNGLWNPSH